MPTIALHHVTKRYEAQPGNSPDLAAAFSSRALFSNALYKKNPTPLERENALDNLSLVIHNGETLAVLGPSGCGKTTLLKVIAGLITPDSGEVLYDGQPVQTIPADKRGIGMVFQDYALYPHLSVHDNIAFFDLLHRQPQRIPERIRHIVDVMGVQVEHLLSRKPPTLSGGEKQRVAVARCLARDPAVFLFDEPLANLDAQLRTETRVQLKRLLQYYKITSVYVTHDQTEAIALADRIAIMREGKIEQIGTFQTLYYTPHNIFVAQFFGTPAMNLFPGHAYGNGWRGSNFSISSIRPALIEGQPLWLGVRAEHVQVVDSGIPVTVEHIEPLFQDRKQLLYFKIGKQTCIASVPIDLPAVLQQTMQIQFSDSHLYLFDQKTGLRIS